MRLRDTLHVVERLAERGGRAVVMTYLNPVLRYGVDAFARDLAAAGGLGVITPDLIPDEADEWLGRAAAHGLDRIFLVAPSSSEERIASTAAATRGFLYAASTMGVTGARDAVVGHRRGARRPGPRPHRPADRGRARRARGAQAGEVAAFADGVIVGSALVSGGRARARGRRAARRRARRRGRGRAAHRPRAGGAAHVPALTGRRGGPATPVVTA